MSHLFFCRVYYEDTDLAGIVYYANYFKFIERARSEWVRELGIDQGKLKAERDVVFAVRRVEGDYLKPAVFDDILEVETKVIAIRPARLELSQIVRRDGIDLFVSKVTLVALTGAGAPTRLPQELRQKLAGNS